MSMTLHKMTKPLDEAVGRAKRFGEGDYNAFSDVQISNDEVGTLIHSLQAMAKKVQDALADQVRKARLTSLGELSTSIAHEINNPLLIISLNLEKLDKLLKSGNIDPEKMNNCIQVAHKTVYRIEKIVKGMKALAREGSADPFSQTSVNEIIEQAISVCQGTLRHENIILKIPSVDEKMTCECRGVQISQVLLNLINNASQAIQGEVEKWIEIRVLQLNKTLRFEVINSGPKISHTVAEKLFTSFYTTKKSGEGTGLGLSIGKRIAQDHSGSLSVDLSKSNTCFVLEIPTHQKNAHQAA